MTPQDHLKEIENGRNKAISNQMPHLMSYDDVDWLIARIKRLTEALRFYAEVFPMPMEVVANNEKDKKFEKICTELLNSFHEVARKALEEE